MDEAGELFEPSNRKARSLHLLDKSSGLYALYLKVGSSLPFLEPDDDVPLYIGKADGAGGLARRCHFRGGTRKHSPRKSLAALLEAELDLQIRPFLNGKDGSFETWGLVPESEAALDRWMQANLLLSVIATPQAAALEKPLIRHWAPFLNLTDCVHSESHRKISQLRAAMERRAKSLV